MSTIGLPQPPLLEQKLFDLVVGRPAAAENSRGAPSADGDALLTPMEKKEPPILAKLKAKPVLKRSEKILKRLMERHMKLRKGQSPPSVSLFFVCISISN